jgi:hypothetical protein
VNITKCDMNGNITWQKKYGGDRKDVAKTIQATKDGGYIVAAITRSFTLEPDFWVMKLKASGDTLWTKMFGGLEHEHCYFAKQTPDGGFITGGHTDSFQKNNIDVYLLKLNSSGELKVTGINDLNDLAAHNIKIYPVPSAGYFNIQMQLEKPAQTKLTVTTISGSKVFEEILDVKSSALTKRINTEGFAKGVYLINIASENAVITKKIVVL